MRVLLPAARTIAADSLNVHSPSIGDAAHPRNGCSRRPANGANTTSLYTSRAATSLAADTHDAARHRYYPARTRTWNARTKTWCVTITPPGKRNRPKPGPETTARIIHPRRKPRNNEGVAAAVPQPRSERRAAKCCAHRPRPSTSWKGAASPRGYESLKAPARFIPSRVRRLYAPPDRVKRSRNHTYQPCNQPIAPDQWAAKIE